MKIERDVAVWLVAAVGVLALTALGGDRSVLADDQPPAVISAAAERNPADAWMVSIPDAKLGEVMGFFEGRLVMAKVVGERYPSLKARATSGGAAISAAFKASVDAIMDEAARREPGIRAQWAEMIAPKIAEVTTLNTWSYEEAVKEIEAGVLDPQKQPVEMVALLCAFHPAYRAEPAKEMADGFVALSPVPIPGRAERLVVVEHPKSWADVTSEAEASAVLQLSSGVGAGPVVMRIEAIAIDEEQVTPEGLKQLLTMYGAHESEALKLGPASVIQEGTIATRAAKGRIKTDKGVLHTVGVQNAIVKNQTLVLVYTSAFAMQYAGEPEPKGSLMSAALTRAEPVFERMMRTLSVRAK